MVDLQLSNNVIAGRIQESIQNVSKKFEWKYYFMPMFSNSIFSVRRERELDFIYLEGHDPDRVPIVCLHGMFGGLSNFDQLASMLGYDRTIVIPELPLYQGRSRYLKIQGLADWVFENVFDRFDFGEAIIIGNSLGGHIALECALTNPGRVRALVLAGSSGLFEQNFGYSRPRRFDRVYIRERAQQAFFSYQLEDRIIDEIVQVLASNRKLGRLLKIARSTHEYNMEAYLTAIRQPCLLVWGKNDLITPPAVAESFLKLLPNAQLEWIDKCGHAPMMEHPSSFMKLVSEFLKSIDPVPQLYESAFFNEVK